MSENGFWFHIIHQNGVAHFKVILKYGRFFCRIFYRNAYARSYIIPGNLELWAEKYKSKK